MGWLRSLFSSWEDCIAYLVIVAVTLCGFFYAPLWSIVMAAATLSVLTWAKRWSALVSKANEIDTEYRGLAAMMWATDWVEATRLYLRGYNVVLVMLSHMLNNVGFSTLGFGLGRLTKLFWFEVFDRRVGAWQNLAFWCVLELTVIAMMKLGSVLLENKTKRGRWW